MPMLRKYWSLLSGISLNSVSAQLLLWIALPAALALLVISMIEIRSHEQAMQRLVQTRVTSLTQAIAVLIASEVAHTQAALVAVAAGLPKNTSVSSPPQSAFFAGGMMIFDQNGQSLLQEGLFSWSTHPQVEKLVKDTGQGKSGTTITLFDNQKHAWLSVQAVLMPYRTPAMVLVGAHVLDVQALRAAIQSFLQSDTAELHIESASGQILAELARTHTPTEPDSSVRIVSEEAILPSTGWRIVLREHWSELVPPELRYENVIFTGIAMAIVFSLLAAYVAMRSIISPLRRLNWAASQIGWGNFEAVEQSVSGVTEIEDLRLALVSMTDKIRQSQQQLQSYIGAITLGQEEERKRLARELHDETVQAVIAIKQRVELIEKDMERKPARAVERLHALHPLLTEIVISLRRQIHDLRPLYLEDLGLVSALEMLLQQTATRDHLVTDLTVTGKSEYPLPLSVELSLFRIAQEAIQNVASHAYAESLYIKIGFADSGVTLQVEDDGVGFITPDHPHQLTNTGHYGLLGMQERAQLHGGKFQIKSVIGQGTTVVVWLPSSALMALSSTLPL